MQAAIMIAIWYDVSGLRKGRTDQKQRAAMLAGVSVHYAEEAGAIEDQWMVSFGKKATDATLNVFCAQVGCTTVGHPDEGGLAVAVVKASQQQLHGGIEAHADLIEYIEQDAIAEDFDDVVQDSPSWGLDAIGVPTSLRQGQGVNVYVLDSGVRVTHEDFGGRAIPLYDAANFDTPTVCDPADTSCAFDNRGHGSHVAGSVGGTRYGVAPGSTILAMQRGRSLSDGYSCIDWLTVNRQRPAVLQMSWGTGSQSSVGYAAVDAAVAAGLVTVVASGNSREDACKWTFGGVPSAIAVASTDSRGRRSSFSNFGPCIDIFAPGSDIQAADFSSDTGISTKSGTSMAAPHVSGAAALILEEEPSMSPADVLLRLQADAWEGFIIDSLSENNHFLRVGPPTPAPPTPAPGPPGTWDIIFGTGCEETDGDCVQSSNHPSDYDNNRVCEIKLWGDVSISVKAFNTEARFDTLTVGGKSYSGVTAPADGVYSGKITWNSDFSVVSSGWKLCRN